MAGNKRYKLVILEGASTGIMDLFTFVEEQKQGTGDIFIDNLGDFFSKLRPALSLGNTLQQKKKKSGGVF